jgi:hypothetical protein
VVADGDSHIYPSNHNWSRESLAGEKRALSQTIFGLFPWWRIILPSGKRQDAPFTDVFKLITRQSQLKLA